MVLEIKFVEKPAFRVVGLTESIVFDSQTPPPSNSIAKLWARFGKRIPEIAGEIGSRSFGLMLQNPANESSMCFDYTAAVQIGLDDTAVSDVSVPEGLVCIDVPAARYLVLTHRGHLDGLGESFRYFWGNWLPNHPFEYDGGVATGKYEFEFYDQRYTRPDDPNSEIDLYFPIRAK
ncbi:GyrI-like domain-containing protein [Paenibacillus cymbidii]|uniref:GyrI-like domain-containing protein n=1 Tax=Paenibacillus cymbidii TaxID=1639034 RepID=UPI001081EBD3|nr:GyrI-like domain-containing protein [Paenibacillus cymbidii]